MRIGIIGGYGVFDEGKLAGVEYLDVDTPYGRPSGRIMHGRLGTVDVYVLPRHGAEHTIDPGSVNYRANIHAFKEIGCTHVLSTSAVGSLKDQYRPGDLAFTDQFYDNTKGRKSTFYDTDRVCHVSMAEPFCPELRKLLIATAKELRLAHHETATCLVMEGPRFSTKAESRIYRMWGCDTINMTLCPEVALAREAELCYANVAMVTDYDCWKDHAVSHEEVVATIGKNMKNIQALLAAVVPKIPERRVCGCGHALEGALM